MGRASGVQCLTCHSPRGADGGSETLLMGSHVCGWVRGQEPRVRAPTGRPRGRCRETGPVLAFMSTGASTLRLLQRPGPAGPRSSCF